MPGKYGLLFAAVLALIAVLYQVDVVTTRWEAEEFAIITAEPERLWSLITNIETTNKWFQWVSIIRSVDTRPLGRGKRYEVVYKVPFIGDYALPLQITQFAPNRLIVLESNSLLKPKFSISLEEMPDNYTKIILKLGYKRNSALFRCTLGPITWLLSSQQLKQSLFILKMLFSGAQM